MLQTTNGLKKFIMNFELELFIYPTAHYEVIEGDEVSPNM